jgi:hypothetical protein
MDTIEFRIPRKWWSNFTSETVVEDALGATPGEDEYLDDTRILVEHVEATGRKTKTEIIVTLEWDHLYTVWSQAEWFTYFWGEAMVQEAWDIADRGAWASRGRSSDILCRKAEKALDALRA